MVEIDPVKKMGQIGLVGLVNDGNRSGPDSVDGDVKGRDGERSTTSVLDLVN